MNNIKIWPHLTIVAILCAVLAGAGVALYLKNQQSAEAAALPNAARIQRVEGEVALTNSLDPAFANTETNAQSNNEANTQWVAAAPNQPFSVGDRIYTRENSHASLAFTGRNYARLDPNTGLDVLTLEDRRTQLALRDGSAMFDVGYLEPGEVFEVATPYGAVNFDQPGLYNVGLDNGSAIVSVLSGLAQVVGLGGSGQINKGEMLTLLGQTAAQVVLSRLNRDDAGSLVDNYYQQQYPNNYDGRYTNYDTYLEDPFYYDPYRSNASYQHVSAAIPGINDLDAYGDWQNVAGYGNVWRPRVETGWVPYQEGQWVNDYPYGPTWVSTEPWGYAPYHYGRWANVNNQWVWIPEAVNTTPQYSPALVAFVPLNGDSQIGWVPLAPGDVYAPRYYDENWQPNYLSKNAVAPAQLINLAVPGAVTVVPLQEFTRVIDRRMVRTTNPQSLAQVRPTLDPLTLTPLRNAVMNSAWGRGKISLPPGIAKKLYETRVVTNATPFAPHSKKDVAKIWRAERVSDKVKGQKFDVRDDRRGEEVRHAARRNEVNAPVADKAKDNKEARRQQHELEKQQAEQARAARQAVPQAQGQRVGHPKPKVEKQERKPQAPQVEFHPKPQHQTAPAQGNKDKDRSNAQPREKPGQGGKGKGKGRP